MYRTTSKIKVEALFRLNIFDIKKSGYLARQSLVTYTFERGLDYDEYKVDMKCNTLASSPNIELTHAPYKNSDKIVTYIVPLTTTPCNFGGERWWFICPNIHCKRRVGILYMCGGFFDCRHCHNLTYASRDINRHSYFYTLADGVQAQRMIERLGEWRPTYAGRPTRKQRRYDQLEARVNRSTAMILDGSIGL